MTEERKITLFTIGAVVVAVIIAGILTSITYATDSQYANFRDIKNINAQLDEIKEIVTEIRRTQTEKSAIAVPIDEELIKELSKDVKE
jgi:Tfp pilus assembly protein PilE